MPIISPKIPSGLEDLMRGLAKSCIKENPDNIYEFAAEYFENLLKQRDVGLDQGYKNFATYKVYKKNRSARSRRDKENVIDGNSFRGGVGNGFGQELIKSGSAKEKYFASEDKSEIEEIFLPASRPSTAEILDKSISLESEINTVIVKEPSIEDEGVPIQSINSDEDDVKNMVLDADMEQAALKIQSTFRGFKTRKEMREDKGDEMEIDEEDVVVVKNEETSLSAGLPSVDSMKDDAEQLGSDVENAIEGSESMLKTDTQEEENKLDTITSSQEDVDSHVIPLMTEDNETESTTKDIDDDETAEIAENQSEVTDIECTEDNVTILNDEDLTATSEQEQTEVEHELVEGVEIIETCLEHQVSENLKHSTEVIEENSEIIDEKPEENHENSQEVCVENIEQNADVEKSEEIELDVTEKLEVESPIPNDETQQETLQEEESTTMSIENNNEENPAEIVNDENVDTEIVNDIPDATELISQSKSSEDQVTVEEIMLDEDNAETKVERDVDTMENVSEETLEKLSVEMVTQEASLEAIEMPEENILLAEKLSSEVVEDAAVGSIEKFVEIVEATGEVDNLQEDVNENEAENIVSEDVMNVNNNTMPEGTENTDESSTTVDLIAIENVESLPENVIQSMDKIDSTQITPDASMNEIEKLIETEAAVDEAAENIIQTEAVDEATEIAMELIQHSCEDLLEIEAVDETETKESPIEEANLELTQDEKSEDQNETLENVESAIIPNETMEKENLVETEGSNASMDKSQESSGEQQEVVEIIEKKSVDKLETIGVIESVDEVDIKEPLEMVKQASEDEDVFVMNADEILAIVEMSIEQTTPEINELANDNETDNVSVDNVEAEAVLDVVSETLSAQESAEKETECSIDIPPTEKSIDDSFINSGEDIGAVAPSDDILEPEKEESEIPEESSTTIDENLTTDEVPVITNEDNENQSSIDVTDEIIPEGQQENEVPKVTEEEDVSDMILDDEMEGAALKIQAAFRGHQVRKDNAPPTNSNDNENDNKNEEENQSEEKPDNEIVIDNCSNEQLFSTEENDTVNEETAVEVEDNEETTAQETKEDEVEEETQTEEETNEEEEKEAEEEENVEEEEVEVETVENEGGSDEPDATGEPADQASGSTEQATNDDDDVANMVMDEDMEQAALKIQSTFRGHKTRKDMKNKEEETVAEETADASEEKKDTVEELDEDVANMVLDEEMEQAALKIQSTFRGHKTRKDMKNKDGEDETEEKEENEVPKEEEEKPEEPKPEETKSEESTSSGKTAQQLQDEEDIANIVMDKDMEKAALKIQNTFRGKRFGVKKGTQDEDISYESSNSSAPDQNEEDNNLEASNESPIKILSEEEQFTNEDTIKLSQEQSNESVDKSVTEENDSNFMAAQQYSGSNDERYSIDRFNDMSPQHQHQQQHQESFEIGNSIEMILMKSSEELIGESATCDVTSGASGEDKENDDENEKQKMKTISIENGDVDEVEEPLAVEKVIHPLTITSMEDEKLIENFDFNKNKNSAEAMYMQLKKNEMETQKQVTVDAIEHMDEDEEEDDDDVVVSGATVVKARKLKYGMSMDDRLLGLSRSILSQDYSPKMQKIDSGEEHGYNPMLEASKQSTNFMDQLHSRSIESDEGKDDMMNYNKYSDGMGDEDQFDDFYPGNIRQKMMASSISIADSDYFDPTKSQVINDDTIRTALETINSTDSESTIASAATKIQAGARGLITRRKLNNNASSSQQYASYASFGNAAIDKSLDDFIVAQEQERLEEESEGDVNAHDLPKHESTDEWTDDDKKSENVGVIGIKLEQKNFLTVDERRRTLHREDAIQRNSTSSNTSSEKLIDNNNSTQMETVVDIQSQQPLETAEEPISIQEVSEPKEVATTKPKSVVSVKTSKIPKSMISRQKTMPVQIDTNLIRILPKHLRKRIRSAESDKKKKSK